MATARPGTKAHRCRCVDRATGKVTHPKVHTKSGKGGGGKTAKGGSPLAKGAAGRMIATGKKATTRAKKIPPKKAAPKKPPVVKMGSKCKCS